jgi:hypothetical protein
LLRLGKSLRRLDFRAKPDAAIVPPDRAWHELLSRLDAEEAERRLDAVAEALNGRDRH